MIADASAGRLGPFLHVLVVVCQKKVGLVWGPKQSKNERNGRVSPGGARLDGSTYAESKHLYMPDSPAQINMDLHQQHN